MAVKTVFNVDLVVTIMALGVAVSDYSNFGGDDGTCYISANVYVYIGSFWLLSH